MQQSMLVELMKERTNMESRLDGFGDDEPRRRVELDPSSADEVTADEPLQFASHRHSYTSEEVRENR